MAELTFEVKPKDLSVVIGMPLGPYLPWQTAISLAGTTAACAVRGIPCEVTAVAGSSIVTDARTKVADGQLASEAARVFFIDSDIVWAPADFLRLLLLSTKMPVVCGAYPQKNEKRMLPVSRLPGELETNEYGCYRVRGAGLGFTVVRREVLERLAATKPRVYDPEMGADLADLFRLDRAVNEQGRRVALGEDTIFFDDVRGLGYDCWLDPSIDLGHVGSHVYRRARYLPQSTQE